MVPSSKTAPWNNKGTPPLTPEDGAARILDPILEGLKEARGQGGHLRTGVYLRNFKPVCW